MSMLFYRILKARGWKRATIEPIFTAAYEKISHQPQRQPNEESDRTNVSSNRDLMILHMKYHPDDIPRRKIRELYLEHCANEFENFLGIRRTIVAYSRPKNLRDILKSAKLYERSGSKVSTFLGG